jgi:hypothetical protein
VPRPVVQGALLRSPSPPSSARLPARELAVLALVQSRAPRSPGSAFAGFRFPPDVIVLAVRWYLRFGLSYRDVEEFLTERGVQVDHVTIYRWVQRFTLLLADAAGPCRHRVGIAGRWTRPT